MSAEDVQDGPRPELDGYRVVEPAASAPPAFPAVETPAAAAAAQARSAVSAPEPPNVGGEGCSQDPKASGLDVLVGAVDIVGAADIELRGNRTGPVATGHDSSVHRSPTPAAAVCDAGALSDETSRGGSVASSGGEKEDTAYRALPRAFAVHAPNTGTGGAGAAAGALPGFSAMTHPVGADDTSFSAPGTAASPWRERRVDDGYSFAPASSPRPPLGPTARDTYAELTGAALPAAQPASAFPGLSPKQMVYYDDEGFKLSPAPPPETDSASKPGKRTSSKRKAAKKTKALKTKAVKAKAIITKKMTPKAKTKSGASRSRRGPAGQSHFKGVCLTPSGTWRAVIYVDRRQKYLGVFDNEFDAARAYDAAAVLHFPDATPLLNNPDDVERQLNSISAADGKPFATAGAPELPDFKPTPLRLDEGYGTGARA